MILGLGRIIGLLYYYWRAIRVNRIF